MPNFVKVAVIVAAIVMSAGPGHGAPSCQSYLTAPFEVVLNDYPSIRQCAGSCYFEAAVAYVEGYLRAKWQMPVYISRSYLFSLLLEDRLSAQPLQGEVGSFDFRNGYVDVASSGSFKQVVELIRGRDILLLSKRTQAQNYWETQAMHRVHARLGDSLAQLRKALRFKKQQLHTASAELSDIASEKLVAATRSVKQAVFELKDLRAKAQSHLSDSRLISGSEILRSLQLKRWVVYGMPHSHWEPVIKHELNEQRPVVVRYLHFRNSSSDVLLGPKDGVGEVIPVAEALQRGFLNRSEFGEHEALIVGYKLDQDGHITALKIRNSHGEKRPDRGYLLMPIDFFKTRGLTLMSLVKTK